MLTTVGQKGQIVIEKTIREALGLQPGYVAVQKLAGDHVEIYFYPPEHKKSLRGILADKIKRPAPTTEWAIIREQVWSAMAVTNEEESSDEA
ncbi:MAG: AbrB/MazE/SpoVT family DNA-binding domain-containing protein [Chloroflexi bacterium]|nr:AbrB/MazE/SpoVT family DNA-binding domain-containing protein [Chloroflexota bacterium]